MKLFFRTVRFDALCGKLESSDSGAPHSLALRLWWLASACILVLACGGRV